MSVRTEDDRFICNTRVLKLKKFNIFWFLKDLELLPCKYLIDIIVFKHFQWNIILVSLYFIYSTANCFSIYFNIPNIKMERQLAVGYMKYN